MDSPRRHSRRCSAAWRPGLADSEKVMTSKANWFWISTAAALFAFIFFYQRHAHKPPPGPTSLLANFKPAAVTSIQVRPEGQLEIRAERTNGTWALTQPLVYPAEALNVESLLIILERLTPTTYITRRELATRPKAEEEYGFGAPLATIIVWRGDYRSILFIGAKTAPGDQVRPEGQLEIRAERTNGTWALTRISN